MNEQQKKAAEEAAEKITFDVYGESDDSIDDVSGFYKQGVEAGMHQVLNNPSKYGIQPINEAEEG